ncbi:MAG TPA: glycosyl hydrolase, partial [Candidatus Paceibacterota bacterium]|nr:glycosyl hydrolase [Candidatus Paceibacterota bacterium]
MPEAQKPFARSILRSGFLIGVLSVALTFARGVSAFQPDTPVTPDASREAQSLLAFLSDIYGKKTLSGQQRGWRDATNELSFEFDYIKRHTGKLPVIVGLDLSGVTMQRPGRTNSHEVVDQAIDWHKRNGVVMICWHWHVPTGNRAFYTKDTDFDLRQALIEGTPEHTGILRDIDTIAEELKLLRDAHVPVLWRPLHEANGRWFWWGAQGAEPCVKLWRLMFDRLTTEHHLNNLIWVFSPGASMDLADWYPGDAYVDIIGQDHYPMDGNHAPAKDVFDELVAFGRDTKLVGMSENGPIPDLELMQQQKADWLFFVTWSGDILTGKNTPEQLRAAFNHPRVLNLDDLPELKTYPFKSAGKPVKLAFPSTVTPVAVGGLRRSPLTVAVQDEDGRAVRDGEFKVTLALQKKNS